MKNHLQLIKLYLSEGEYEKAMGYCGKLEEEKEITLSDVCVKLFELDDLASISFGECRNGEIIPSQTAPGEWEEAYGPCIYFKNDSIRNFISEWIEMKEINVKNKALKSNLYTTWKIGSIVENKDKYKSTKFQDMKWKTRMIMTSY